MDQINLVPDLPAREYLIAVRDAYPGDISNRRLALGVVHAAMKNIPAADVFAEASPEELPPWRHFLTLANVLIGAAILLALVNTAMLGFCLGRVALVDRELLALRSRQDAGENRLNSIDQQRALHERAIMKTMDDVDGLKKGRQ